MKPDKNFVKYSIKMSGGDSNWCNVTKIDKTYFEFTVTGGRIVTIWCKNKLNFICNAIIRVEKRGDFVDWVSRVSLYKAYGTSLQKHKMRKYIKKLA